jgi:hypothetical protein
MLKFVGIPQLKVGSDMQSCWNVDVRCHVPCGHGSGCRHLTCWRESAGHAAQLQIVRQTWFRDGTSARISRGCVAHRVRRGRSLALQMAPEAPAVAGGRVNAARAIREAGGARGGGLVLALAR